MRKIAAASAALLALVFGLVTWTVVAQNRDRSAEHAPVRASLVIRHVVQEGENLTTDDGRYGPGGIMQHYLGRHRSGDIGRLRAYDGNRRAIWITRCEWPENFPEEERTPLQDCPDAYARYSIRRSAGRVIEIPMRWIPTARLAELTRTTPGIARDMRRIALSMNAPGTTVVSGDPGMANEDPTVDAPVASAAVAEVDMGTAPDAGVDAGNSSDAGVVLAGGTGGTGGADAGTGGGEDTPNDDAWFTTTLQWMGITVAALAGLMLLISLGLMIRQLTPSEIAAIKKELLLLWIATKRRWTANEASGYNWILGARIPVDPNDNPEMLRKARDGYRDGNIALTAENATLQQQIIDAKKITDGTKVADDAHTDIERVLKQVGAQLGTPYVEAEPAETYGKRSREAMLNHAKQVATVIQKVALATGKSSADYKGIVAELQKVVVGIIKAPAMPPPPPDATKRIEELEQALAAAREEVSSIGRSSIVEINELATERTQTVSTLERRIAELEQANADLAQSIASGGRPAREDADDELASEETQIVQRDHIQGTPSIEPLAGSETSPGVGLAEVAGAPRNVTAPTMVRSTVGYDAMRPREDATTEVAIPRPDKVPVVDEDPLNAPPETDTRSARQKRKDKRRGTP